MKNERTLLLSLKLWIEFAINQKRKNTLAQKSLNFFTRSYSFKGLSALYAYKKSRQNKLKYNIPGIILTERKQYNVSEHRSQFLLEHAFKKLIEHKENSNSKRELFQKIDAYHEEKLAKKYYFIYCFKSKDLFFSFRLT